jgi:hypothetical protein
LQRTRWTAPLNFGHSAHRKGARLIEILTTLLVAITGFYAWATLRILCANEQVISVMQEQSKAINRPYIAAAPFWYPGAS